MPDRSTSYPVTGAIAATALAAGALIYGLSTTEDTPRGSLLIFHGSGCWEDQNGNFMLVNTTERVNCWPVHGLDATGHTQLETITYQRRWLAGLPVPDALP